MFTTLLFWEAVRVGRQRYHWPLRSAVSLAMLAAMTLVYFSVLGSTGTTSGKSAAFGRWFFDWVALMQFSAGVAVGLAFSAAGMIDERNRGTLADALALGVGPLGFVASKAAIAMARAAETTIVLSPFAAMCILLGGIRPELVLHCAAVTLSAAFLAVGLGLLGGVLFRSLPEALVVVGLPMMCWYILPAILPFLGVFLPPGIRVYNAPYQLNYWSMADPRSMLLGLGVGAAALLVAAAGLKRAVEPRVASASRSKPSGSVENDALEWLHRRFARTLAARWMRQGLFVVGVLAAAVVVRQWLVQTGPMWGREPQFVTSAAAFTAFVGGLMVLPACLLVGASVGGLERARNVREILLLTSLSERELLRSKGRALFGWCVQAAAPCVLLAATCVALGWTTAAGAAIAILASFSAMLACAAFGLRLGWRTRRPAAMAATLAVAGVVAFGAAPLILYTSALPRTRLVYHAFTAFAPAVHSALILCVDHSRDYNPNGYCTDGPLERIHVRIGAIGVSAAYLLAATMCFCWPTESERTLARRRRSGVNASSSREDSESSQGGSPGSPSDRLETGARIPC